MATQENVTENLSLKEASTREDSSFGVIFRPVLFRQRYFLAIKYIEKFTPFKLVDFGCAEGKFIWHLREKNFSYLHEILGVDIDKPTLKRCQNVAKPHKAVHNIDRATPLKIGLYCGSLTQWDPRLEGVEFVSLIEVIEHLEEDTLTQLPTAIFGTLRPKYVFITTPNSEFNILFKDFSGFRHPDHKFEWNREEFMNWCEAICHNFPYQVEYNGAGEPPIGFEEVGYCSQAAFFSLKLEIPNKHLQVNNNNTIDWDNPTTQDDQSDSPLESSTTHPKSKPEPKKSEVPILTKEIQFMKLESTNVVKQEPSPSNMELIYREVICKEFPLKTDEPRPPVKPEL
ncbi:Small RNA 2'-O-methyltransferase-like [Oopsacas minuta]|uniref:Small RNA 2'-O-methyltransferase n=1 Tax=Oopsacas minuta TaxID=111878 RepID=A0AAV7KDB2_9METZ|nr:Small RNA 2'-O-methyltransferase-like [Oopsacas minuta]